MCSEAKASLNKVNILKIQTGRKRQTTVGEGFGIGSVWCLVKAVPLSSEVGKVWYLLLVDEKRASSDSNCTVVGGDVDV